MLNESHVKIIKEVESIKVPTMEYILMKEYGIKLSDEEECKWCGKPCKNTAGISAHLKTCEDYLNSEQFIVDEAEKEKKKNKIKEPRGRKQKKESELNTIEIK